MQIGELVVATSKWNDVFHHVLWCNGWTYVIILFVPSVTTMLTLHWFEHSCCVLTDFHFSGRSAAVSSVTYKNQSPFLREVGHPSNHTVAY